MIARCSTSSDLGSSTIAAETMTVKTEIGIQ